MRSYKKLRLLPISAIYGGNAAGKTTFVEAISKLQRMVISGQPEGVPFALDDESEKLPTCFSIHIIVDDILWEYDLGVLEGEVQEEKLSFYEKENEVPVFVRKLGEELYFNTGIIGSQEDADFAAKYCQKVPKTQLLLHAASSFELKGTEGNLGKVYNWFRKSLCVIHADSRRGTLSADIFNHADEYSSILKSIDTGIVRFEKIELPIERLNIPEEMLSKFKDSDSDIMIQRDDASLLVRKNEDGSIRAYKWFSLHQGKNALATLFPFSDESDGTRRFLHLAPVIIEERRADSVYVIDELDRSLHPLLTRFFIQKNIEKAMEGIRKQVIFTTHDVSLLDHSLLRKDETWAAEKNRYTGESTLIKFSEYVEAQKDRDIRKSYLEGRLGGIPDIED